MFKMHGIGSVNYGTGLSTLPVVDFAFQPGLDRYFSSAYTVQPADLCASSSFGQFQIGIFREPFVEQRIPDPTIEEVPPPPLIPPVSPDTEISDKRPDPDEPDPFEDLDLPPWQVPWNRKPGLT